MIRVMKSILSSAAVLLFCAGCATQQPTAQQEASIQENKAITQSISRVNKEDIHGASSESLSGKDYSPRR